MAHGDEPRDARDAGGSPPRYSLDVQSALVSDGFTNPNLAADDAPPPYGELHDQLQFSQPGFEAGANVTGGCPHAHRISSRLSVYRVSVLARASQLT